jgi:hypothetical protein
VAHAIDVRLWWEKVFARTTAIRPKAIVTATSKNLGQPQFFRSLLPIGQLK